MHAETKKVAVSEEVPILNWVLTRDMVVPTNFRFDLDFRVSESFGTPGAIIVRNSHVHEFLLVSFSVQTPDKKVFNFPANSWVYNTMLRDGRIIFSNDVRNPSLHTYKAPSLYYYVPTTNFPGSHVPLLPESQNPAISTRQIVFAVVLQGTSEPHHQL